jgi:hypothetical protein
MAQTETSMAQADHMVMGIKCLSEHKGGNLKKCCHAVLQCLQTVAVSQMLHELPHMLEAVVLTGPMLPIFDGRRNQCAKCLDNGQHLQEKGTHLIRVLHSTAGRESEHMHAGVNSKAYRWTTCTQMIFLPMLL